MPQQQTDQESSEVSILKEGDRNQQIPDTHETISRKQERGEQKMKNNQVSGSVNTIHFPSISIINIIEENYTQNITRLVKITHTILQPYYLLFLFFIISPNIHSHSPPHYHSSTVLKQQFDRFAHKFQQKKLINRNCNLSIL